MQARLLIHLCVLYTLAERTASIYIAFLWVGERMEEQTPSTTVEWPVIFAVCLFCRVFFLLARTQKVHNITQKSNTIHQF